MAKIHHFLLCLMISQHLLSPKLLLVARQTKQAARPIASVPGRPPYCSVYQALSVYTRVLAHPIVFHYFASPYPTTVIAFLPSQRTGSSALLSEEPQINTDI